MPPLSSEQAARVEHHAPLVDKIAQKVIRTLPPDVDIEELRSAGYEGLVSAAMRFDTSHAIPFPAFAYYRVRGAMIDYLRLNNPGSRPLARALRLLQTTQDLAEDSARQNKDATQLSMEKRVEMARRLVEQTTAAVIMNRASGDKVEQIESDQGNPEESMMSYQTHAALQSAINDMPCEARDMLVDLHYNGTPMAEVAQRLGVNKSTVSRRHSRLIRQLAKKLSTSEHR